MGFFSSRKVDEEYISTSENGPGDRTVVQVIRSRFYGRGKGKGREESEPPPTFRVNGTSTAQTLSHPSPPQAGGRTIKPSKSTSHLDDDSNRRTPRTPNSPLNLTRPSNARASISYSRSRAPSTSSVNAPPSIASPRKPTDTVTMTLAQRLNELATANSEGLLNDDEYRLLRQDLFERFASTTAVPTEKPLVPLSRPSVRGSSTMPDSRTSFSSSRMSSNFTVDVPRSPSIQSKVSATSGMSALFRRGSSSHHKASSTSNDFSDTASMWSVASNSSRFKFPRLRKKNSASSMQSVQADTISISSRRTTSNTKDSEHMATPFSPASVRSVRKMATPPSSFKVVPSVDPKYNGSMRNVFDEQNLQTSVQIKQEIAAVEAEARRLMDAFHGLELSTLTKKGVGEVSTLTLVPDGGIRRRLPRDNSDGVSIRSGISVGSTAAKSSRLHPKRSGSTMNSSSRPNSLHRKGSMSSMSSRGYGGLAPPVPALPPMLGQLGLGSTSSLNLTRSTGHLPMTSVPEDDVRDREEEIDEEMEDIRQRREEVSKRYEARLEYLRARLKGAQLHEKLMKK